MSSCHTRTCTVKDRLWQRPLVWLQPEWLETETTPTHPELGGKESCTYWLPVKERITFKIMVYTLTLTLTLKNAYKCIYGLAPPYLSSLLRLYHPARSGLRSASDSSRLYEHSTKHLLTTSSNNTILHSSWILKIYINHNHFLEKCLPRCHHFHCSAAAPGRQSIKNDNF